MYDKTFVEDCLNANATMFDLNRYVEYWHKHETGNSLQEFLGLTDYEFAEWGVSDDSIFRDFLRCRMEGIDFQGYRRLDDNERKAARSYDENAIEELKRTINE